MDFGKDTNVYRTYTNINKRYAGLVPYPQSPPALPYIRKYDDDTEQITAPAQVTSYAEWCDAVARSLGLLTSDSYVDTLIQPVFSTSQELGG